MLYKYYIYYIYIYPLNYIPMIYPCCWWNPPFIATHPRLQVDRCSALQITRSLAELSTGMSQVLHNWGAFTGRGPSAVEFLGEKREDRKTHQNSWIIGNHQPPKKWEIHVHPRALTCSNHFLTPSKTKRFQGFILWRSSSHIQPPTLGKPAARSALADASHFWRWTPTWPRGRKVRAVRVGQVWDVKFNQLRCGVKTVKRRFDIQQNMFGDQKDWVGMGWSCLVPSEGRLSNSGRCSPCSLVNSLRVCWRHPHCSDGFMKRAEGWANSFGELKIDGDVKAKSQ